VFLRCTHASEHKVMLPDKEDASNRVHILHQIFGMSLDGVRPRMSLDSGRPRDLHHMDCTRLAVQLSSELSGQRYLKVTSIISRWNLSGDDAEPAALPTAPKKTTGLLPYGIEAIMSGSASSSVVQASEIPKTTEDEEGSDSQHEVPDDPEETSSMALEVAAEAEASPHVTKQGFGDLSIAAAARGKCLHCGDTFKKGQWRIDYCSIVKKSSQYIMPRQIHDVCAVPFAVKTDSSRQLRSAVVITNGVGKNLDGFGEFRARFLEDIASACG
jgi:hypothetical protein